MLLEVDFKTMHKINFNGRVMTSLDASSSIPQEIIGGKRSQKATHLDLINNLIEDMSNTAKSPTATKCTDITHYYD